MSHKIDFVEIDYENSDYELDVWSSCFNPSFSPPPEVIKKWNHQFDDDWDETEPTLENTSVYFTEDGTNFDRPAFQRMMDDVDAGRINCIITKDLSRFGREHVVMDYYLEFVFPEKNIRYIAVTENEDIEKGLSGINGENLEEIKVTLSRNEKKYIFESELLHILFRDSIINAIKRFRKIKNI